MPKDNKDELFYWVDEDDNVLGSVRREEANSNPQKIHRAVQIVLINEKNQTLMQKRSLGKDSFPGFWTVSASGHVDYGEESDLTAQRELEEEIGLRGVMLEYKGKHILHMKNETEFEFLYLGRTDQTPSTLDKNEVSEVAWIDLNKLPQFIKDDKVTPAAIETYRALGYLD